MISNPQRLEWDSNVDGYVRVDKTGKRYNYDDKEYSKVDGSPFDAKTGSWTSGFEAGIQFSTHAPCPSCHAPHLQWCEHCDTIFCPDPTMITKTSLIRALIAKTHMVGVLAIARRLRKSLMGNIFALLPQKNVNL